MLVLYSHVHFPCHLFSPLIGFYYPCLLNDDDDDGDDDNDNDDDN